MSIQLSDLVTQLAEDIPAENGVPSESQYTQAVKEAVVDFGNRAGRTKQAKLNIVAGTDAYTLPADFLKMIQLPSLNSGQDVAITPDGIIPLSANFRETYTIVGGQIIFDPVPTYTMVRSYRYKAGYALDEGIYPELTETHVVLLMKLARSLALRRKANAAGGGINYRQGDVSVDTTQHATSLALQADALKSDYLDAVDAYNGATLVMG